MSSPQPPAPGAELDALVRRVDEDRWLASRFAPAETRRRLIALYAVNYEIARTAEVVREAALGDIRLEWWRSALADIAQGAPPRDHPALLALAGVMPVAARGLQTIAQTRRSDLDAAPFGTWADIDRYVDLTAGELMRVAIAACSPAADSETISRAGSAGRAWGYAGLLRAEAFWRARGRDVFPREGGGRPEMLDRARAAYAAAHSGAAPAAVFPALGYAALLPGYLRALDSGAGAPPLFFRHLALIGAAARGRV